MTRHYRYGGSTWGRTIQCPAWSEFCEARSLNSVESVYATEGIKKHENIARYQLSENPSKNDLSALSDDERQALDILSKMGSKLPRFSNSFVEYRVEITQSLSDSVGGTPDLQFIDFDTRTGTATLGIVDFKFGYQRVRAANNPQLLFYAVIRLLHIVGDEEQWLDCDLLWGRVEDYLLRVSVKLIVIQPDRSDSADIWVAPPEVVLDHTRRILAILNGDTSATVDDFNVGTYCQYCPALGHCPATRPTIADVARGSKNLSEVIPDYATLTRVKQTLKQYEAVVREQLENHESVPGFALVKMRGQRRFTVDEAFLATVDDHHLLGEAYEVAKIKSPAQLEIVCKKNNVNFNDVFSKYVVKTSSGTKLAAAEDDPVVMLAQALALKNGGGDDGA